MNTAEKKLLLACAHVNLTEENTQKIRNYAPNVSDWHFFLQTSMAHGVFPLAYRSLIRTCSDLMPTNVLDHFKTIFRQNAAYNLSTSATLLQILELFKSNSIVAVPFKGPLLAEQVYGDASLRIFSDLDILVKKADAIRAKNLLTKNGYNADINLTPEDEKKYLEFENSFSLNHRKNGPDIDLHWEMTGRYLLNPIYLTSVETNLLSSVFMGKPLLTLPDDVMLIYLCIHGNSHCWERLEWLCCFSEMLQQRHFDTSNVLSLAETMGCKRMFMLGLHLCHDLLNTKIPEGLLDKSPDDRGVINTAKKIKKSFFKSSSHQAGDAEWHFSPLHIQIRDTYIDRIKYAVFLYTMPTIKEWSKWPQMAHFPFLLRVLRPIRLASKFLIRKSFTNTYTGKMIGRMEELIEKERRNGYSRFYSLSFHVSGKVLQKILKTFTALINKHFYNKHKNF